MHTLTITSEYHTNGIRQPINVEGYLLFFAVHVSTTEYCHVEELAIFFFNLFWPLATITKMLEYFTHSGRGSVRFQRILYSFRTAHNSTTAGRSGDVSTELGLSQIGQKRSQSNECLCFLHVHHVSVVNETN